jgi:hypothetical protein
MDEDVRSFPADLLAQLCAEKSFKRANTSSAGKRGNVDNSCFELIRRAFKLEDGYCLGLVLDLYRRIWSKLWIRNPYLFEQTPLTADDFTSISFMNVYRLFRGDGFDSFHSLGPFLVYLRRALVRTIAEYNRAVRSRPTRVENSLDSSDSDPIEQIAAEDNLQKDVEDNLLRQAIEERIAVLFPDPKDRFFFDCWAKQDLSRAEIVEEYVTRWQDADPTFDVDDVRVTLQRIRRHLLKDPILRKLLQEYRSDSSSVQQDKN